ncbi:ribokinase [Roseovarius sp. 2305UL8-3]|uniref:ribokinase n=1 Tax=Roseovarius conchicola TaxID=3121636 RepID=UPI0035299A65
MIFNLGSINADYIYRVPHLPAPGETLAASDMTRGLGGKGANQSVAAALAGSQVTHIGAVGPDGGWAVEALMGYGVITSQIATVDTPTAHAIINVDRAGENAIVIYPGANHEQSLSWLETALSIASHSDLLLLQNETSLQVEAAEMAHKSGLHVVYSAAPFSAEAVQAVLPYLDLLVMNAVEATQLTTALGLSLEDIPVRQLLITRGADGADWIENSEKTHCPAFAVTPVDTTGAGDCFTGYVAAGLDQGLSPKDAMRRAAAASALQVQRPGTAEAIPTATEVASFLA